MENWKPVKLKGVRSYEVSDMGNVRSLPRKVKTYNPHKNAYYTMLKHGKQLKKVKTKTGYPQVTIRRYGKKTSVHIHRLVALTFVPNSEGKPFVNHKDGNKTNNNVTNLEWVTPKENAKHASDNNLVSRSSLGLFGKDHPASKQVIQLKEGKIVKRWPSASDAVRQIGVDSWGISKCCRGKQRTHYGYEWRYVN